MWRAFVGSRLAMMAVAPGGKDKAAAIGKDTATSVGKKTSGTAPLSEKQRNSGILKVLPVSPSMRKFLGVPEASRTDALKKVWQYIKDNNLQVGSLPNMGIQDMTKFNFSLYLEKTLSLFIAEPVTVSPKNIKKDPANKKEIKCDEKLKAIFEGKDSVGFLEIARLLNRHFVKAS